MLRLIFAAIILFWLIQTAVPIGALAQDPTPAPTSTQETTDDGFFSGLRFGDIIDLISAAAIVVLGFYLWRFQGARLELLEQQVQSAKDSLDEQRKRCADEIDQERRHTEQLREQHAAAEELLKRQIEFAERDAGIDPSGLVTSDKAQLPADVKQNLSEILSLLREMKTASQRFEVVSPLPPEEIAQEHLNQGNAYFAAEDYERALTEYATALAVQPDDATILSNRGTTLYYLARYEEALAAYDRALELNADDSDILMKRGGTLQMLGRYPEAVAHFDRSLQLRPDEAHAHYGRALALYYLARYKDALAAYDKALELRPNDPSTLGNRAIALLRLSRIEEAASALDRAVQLDTHRSRPFYMRACFFSVLGRTDEALGSLERAISTDPRRRGLARRDPDFDNIRNHPEYGPRFQELVGEAEPPQEAIDKD